MARGGLSGHLFCICYLMLEIGYRLYQYETLPRRLFEILWALQSDGPAANDQYYLMPMSAFATPPTSQARGVHLGSAIGARISGDTSPDPTIHSTSRWENFGSRFLEIRSRRASLTMFGGPISLRTG